MLSSLRKTVQNKSLPVFALVLIVSILIGGTSSRTKFAIARRVLSTTISPFIRAAETWRTIQDRHTENLSLKRQLMELTLKLQMYKQIASENKRLSDMLLFCSSSKLSYPVVPVQIVGTPFPGQHESVLVNAGSNRSIVKGLAAITAEGLVGKVLAVYPQSAVVQLISDPAFRVSVRDNRSRVVGIVRPMDRYLSVDKVPVTADVSIGDQLITSGLSSSFPKGISVGTIIGVENPPSGLFKRIRARPAASSATVEELFIVLPSYENNDTTAVESKK